MFVTTVILVLCTTTCLSPARGDTLMISDRYGNPPTHPDPCIRTCVGATGFGSTTWNGSPGSLYAEVDMTECGFVDVPIVTTSIEGRYDLHSHTIGATSLLYLTKTGFKVRVMGYAWTAYLQYSYKITPNLARSYKFSVMWTAVGFICED